MHGDVQTCLCPAFCLLLFGLARNDVLNSSFGDGTLHSSREKVKFNDCRALNVGNKSLLETRWSSAGGGAQATTSRLCNKWAGRQHIIDPKTGLANPGVPKGQCRTDVVRRKDYDRSTNLTLRHAYATPRWSAEAISVGFGAGLGAHPRGLQVRLLLRDPATYRINRVVVPDDRKVETIGVGFSESVHWYRNIKRGGRGKGEDAIGDRGLNGSQLTSAISRFSSGVKFRLLHPLCFMLIPTRRLTSKRFTRALCQIGQSDPSGKAGDPYWTAPFARSWGWAHGAARARLRVDSSNPRAVQSSGGHRLPHIHTNESPSIRLGVHAGGSFFPRREWTYESIKGSKRSMLPHYWTSMSTVDAAAAVVPVLQQEELTEERPTEIARHHRRRWDCSWQPHITRLRRKRSAMPAPAREGASQRSFCRRGGKARCYGMGVWRGGRRMGLLRVTRYIAKLNAIFGEMNERKKQRATPSSRIAASVACRSQLREAVLYPGWTIARRGSGVTRLQITEKRHDDRAASWWSPGQGGLRRGSALARRGTALDTWRRQRHPTHLSLQGP
ncbi:hypothetical protein EDB92DRAFT_1818046 [Lactarius akahatsu]|uniref:Uncharacterized protein n=1 Tax=Lactarius akahatsu TaxID=416441 RepID=A0AAD4QBK7_9AGAM|nr:hypothetical protein EDB92DRAFT_1818046 [Lactarius akahatsu]